MCTKYQIVELGFSHTINPLKMISPVHVLQNSIYWPVKLVDPWGPNASEFEPQFAIILGLLSKPINQWQNNNVCYTGDRITKCKIEACKRCKGTADKCHYRPLSNEMKEPNSPPVFKIHPIAVQCYLIYSCYCMTQIDLLRYVCMCMYTFNLFNSYIFLNIVHALHMILSHFTHASQTPPHSCKPIYTLAIIGSSYMMSLMHVCITWAIHKYVCKYEFT